MPPRNIELVAQVEDLLRSRDVRIRAFISGGAWRVLLSGESSGDIFSGMGSTLKDALVDAFDQCDLRLHHRNGVQR